MFYVISIAITYSDKSGRILIYLFFNLEKHCIRCPSTHWFSLTDYHIHPLPAFLLPLQTRETRSHSIS